MSEDTGASLMMSHILSNIRASNIIKIKKKKP